MRRRPNRPRRLGCSTAVVSELVSAVTALRVCLDFEGVEAIFFVWVCVIGLGLGGIDAVTSL